jgi:arginyl-tRNA synthetase
MIEDDSFSMKQRLNQLIRRALDAAVHSGTLAAAQPWPEIDIDIPKNAAHGDFASSIAMVLAKSLKMPPRAIGQAILSHIGNEDGFLAAADMAGPGFLNFRIASRAWIDALRAIHRSGARYGASDMGQGKRIQVEFVSSNPTGPLHIGHGRGAAVGDSIANILAISGYDVQKEYYINDSGRQIQTLGKSVFLRYRQLTGEAVFFPEDCYQGGYIREIAAEILQKRGETLLDESDDAAILFCARYAAKLILEDMRADLERFGVTYDCWFSEQSLYDTGKVSDIIERFRKQGIIYEKDGALWFRTSDYGDEKDRVVVRNNGQTTYFASDIAYHVDKFERGFETVIDVWGADHHGYIARIAAAIRASGKDPSGFSVILVQLVNLLRGGHPVAMSTRAGEFVTLKEVMNEVGKDSARFLFLTRSSDSPLDFDLELAKKQSNENPVFYVQYVHARICSMIRKANDSGIEGIDWDEGGYAVLDTEEDIQLIRFLVRYPEVIGLAARHLEPHRLAYYLMELAGQFHAYYNKRRVLTDDILESRMRLYLMMAVRLVIRNGLDLLGVAAPESM